MGRHLPAAAGRVAGRAHGLQQLLLYRLAKSKTQGTVTVIGIEPVVAGFQSHAGGYQKRFMAGARDLEEDLLLALEQHFTIVGAAGEMQVDRYIRDASLLRF